MWSSYRAFALRSVTAAAVVADGNSTASSSSSWATDLSDDAADMITASASSSASAIAFAVVGSGAVSSILAGLSADQIGRTTICLVSCVTSSLMSLSVGGLVGNTHAVVLLGVVWGLSIIADSGQYSAMVAELAHPERVGTSLTIQFAVGFAATMPTMYLVPALASGGDASAWGWAFRALAPGPLLAVCALLRLRQLPRARLMAGGKM